MQDSTQSEVTPRSITSEDVPAEQDELDEQWPVDDPRWDKPPTWSRSEREMSALHSRKICPLIPRKDYIVIEVFDFIMYSPTGLVIPGAGENAMLKPVVLMVVSSGPDASEFEPGDMVMSNPRNNELSYEWTDPDFKEPARTYLLMQAKMIIARLDEEVINQFSMRAEHWDVENKKKLAAQSKTPSDMTLPEEKKIITTGVLPTAQAGDSPADA